MLCESEWFARIMVVVVIAWLFLAIGTGRI